MNAERIALTEFAADYDSYAAAIEAARSLGYTLNTYADPTADGQEDVSDEYAASVAREDIGLVYLTR